MQDELPQSAAPAASGDGLTAVPLVLPHAEHGITRRDIDPYAVKVLWRLTSNGFTAYLVGGGVRDLLLKRKPKDFDISTNARPEEIKGLFRNCLLIGRRFRLAHIRYGDKIIETSTFRSAPENSADPNDPEADLFQRDDNIFGTPAEDARRRDFTVNGLFYDIGSFSVLDYVGGIEDLRKRTIRSIGDPCIRFREDPVRMIRAVRFASRLDFTIAPSDLEAIAKHREEIAKASPARLIEEICRLFAFSSGERAVSLLESTGLLEAVLPEVAKFLAGGGDTAPFWRRLAALDEGDTVLPESTQALIFAVLFSDPLRAAMNGASAAERDFRQRFERMRVFIRDAATRLCLPRKLKEKMSRIIGAQARLAGPIKRRAAEAMVRQDWFPEALALAEIDAAVDLRPQAALNPWREMYANISCSRDETRSRGAGQQRNGRPQPEAGAAAPASPERSGDDGRQAQQGQQTPLPGHGLSRSARRRRNRQRNKERRQQERMPAEARSSQPSEIRIVEAGRPESEAPVPPASGDVAVSEAPQIPAVEVAAPAPAADEKRGEEKKRGRSGGKGKTTRREKPFRADSEEKEKAETGDEAASPEPLTAASFYAKPAGKPKAAKPAADRDKKKATAEAAKRGVPPTALRGPDRSEEADLPMHWLDEI